jgi:arabinogalactan endo-1,4-beta-galactosidase
MIIMSDSILNVGLLDIDFGSHLSINQCIITVFIVELHLSNTSNHHTFTITFKGILKQSSQFAIPITYMLLSFAQTLDQLSKHQK